MLRENPQPEITDDAGYTPLHYAAIATTAAATTFLLGQNVNPLITSTNVSLTAINGYYWFYHLVHVQVFI